MGLEAMQLLGQRQLLETPCLRLPPHNFCEPSKGNSCPHTIPDIRPLPIQRPAPQVRQHDEDITVDGIDASERQRPLAAELGRSQRRPGRCSLPGIKWKKHAWFRPSPFVCTVAGAPFATNSSPVRTQYHGFPLRIPCQTSYPPPISAQCAESCVGEINPLLVQTADTNLVP